MAKLAVVDPEELMELVNRTVKDTIKKQKRSIERPKYFNWELENSKSDNITAPLDSISFLHQIKRCLEEPLYAAQKIISMI